jgi:hypothetical protein
VLMQVYERIMNKSKLMSIKFDPDSAIVKRALDFTGLQVSD